MGQHVGDKDLGAKCVKEDRKMENTNRAKVTSAQSREDWLIGRLRNVHENLRRLQMVMTRTAVMNMAEAYLCIEDTTAYLAEKRDEKKDDFKETFSFKVPASALKKDTLTLNFVFPDTPESDEDKEPNQRTKTFRLMSMNIRAAE